MSERQQIEDIYPLSPMQKGMLFHTIADPTAGMYVVQMGHAIHGPYDDATASRAWEAVVARHPALRTSFAWQTVEDPRQVVHRVVTLPWTIEDLRDRPEADQRAHIASYQADDRRRGFDLNHAPLMRFALFRLADDHTYFMWSRHHLLLDGWSTPIVLGEVAAMYRELSGGPAAKLGAARPFRDYIAWLHKRDPADAEAYWRRTLEGFSAPTHIAIARTSRHADNQGYARHEASAAPETAAALAAAARRCGVTVNTLFQAAWAIVLARYAGQDDVVFGTTVSGRPPEIAGIETIVGLFLNTIPTRVRVPGTGTTRAWLGELQREQVEVREHQHTPLFDVQRWSEVPRGVALFETLVVFEGRAGGPSGDREGSELSLGEAQGAERTNYPLTIYIAPSLWMAFDFETEHFTRDAIVRLASSFRRVLEAIAEDCERPVLTLPVLADDEQRCVTAQWNATHKPFDDAQTIHGQFRRQVLQSPDLPAVTFESTTLTYRDLATRAQRLAARLRALGVGPEDRVGLSVERSTDLVIAMLGILEAGAAYVPLDPSYPQERLAYMVEDAGVRVIVTQHLWANRFGDAITSVLVAGDESAEPTAPVEVSPDHIAYTIYTSGSTGRPKGTMLTHRNAVSFFAAMDDRIPTTDSRRVWCAVTSVSFDISILELLWTLTRGFHVIVQGSLAGGLGSAAAKPSRGKLQFGLFYFANAEGERETDRYRLVLDGARFADTHGFSAVWTPERHFHPFGGQYPNPSVLGAAVAAITRRIAIRAGSVVSPLHSPIRIAEEWSVVDNLSNGRAGVSFASGWHAADFVLAPERFADRREQMFRDIDAVRALWRGESLTMRGGQGAEVAVKIYPRPVQPELPIWVTAAGSPATFRAAGERGLFLLTHLLGQTVEELAAKISIYRTAWRDAGHAGSGQVALMIHTFVGPDATKVREQVRAPFTAYLKSSVDLIYNLAKTLGEAGDVSTTDLDAVAALAFDRYFDTSGLFGTPESCLDKVAALEGAGVDELACLIDFGVDQNAVLASLEYLDHVRAAAQSDRDAYQLVPQLARHRVTHLQCTPSLARLVSEEPEALAAIAPLQALLVGGEALPTALARTLSDTVGGELHNMYGPTETTIWSATHRYAPGFEGAIVPLGTPIANTRCYVLDRWHRPTPIGVPGELAIGGPGVARGYHDRPDLTAARFVPDPCSGESGSRLYLTGDVVRWTAEGTLEFLGRVDHQVKIRGVRVELGEIEAAIAAHADVRTVAVIAREESAGDVRLVAYVVPAAGVLDSSELRAHVRARLPEVMVPTAWVRLDALPLTPNGKLDRKALPEPGTIAAAEQRYVAPTTETETTLAAIFAQVFRRERVGITDNFFELGGDSITTVQIVSKARKAGLVLAPRQIFSLPTIAELAAVAGTTTAAATAAAVPATDAVLTRWQRDAIAAGGERSFALVLGLVGPTIDARALETAVRHVRDRHEALRVRIIAPDGRQEIEASPSAPAILASATGIPDAIERANAHGDRARGVIAAIVSDGDPTGDRAVLVFDGWLIDAASSVVVARDVEAAYRAAMRGEAVATGPSSTSFLRWVTAATAAPGTETEHWLEASRAGTPLPRKAEATADRIVVELDDAVTSGLRAHDDATYRTELPDLVLAALAQALQRATGQRDWRIDLEGDGRAIGTPGVDFSDAVGVFRLRFPLRLEVPPRGGLPAIVKAAKDARRNVPRRGAGYAELLDGGDDDVRRALEEAGRAEIQFRHVGEHGEVPAGTRPYVVDVVSSIVNGRLVVHLATCAGGIARSMLKQLADDLEDALRTLAGRSGSGDAPMVSGPTPSDFPAAGLSQDQLDRLMARLSRGK